MIDPEQEARANVSGCFLWCAFVFILVIAVSVFLKGCKDGQTQAVASSSRKL